MRFLVIRLSSMGDIILTQPLLRELWQRFPEAEIDYVTKAQYMSLAQMLDDRLKVIAYNKSISWHRRLRETNYDAVIDLHGKLSSILVGCCARSLHKVRYDKRRSLRAAIVAHRSDSSIGSTVELYASALAKLWDEAVQLQAPKLSVEKVTPLPVERDSGVPVIAIFPGAAHGTKMYPVSYWQQFITQNPGYQFILLGSKAESTIANDIARMSSSATNLCGMFDWEALADILNQCDLVISGDSGPMHLAAALGKPQIAIFGSTHPRLGFAPQNDRAVILQQDLNCRPCSLHGAEKCPLNHFRCMLGISPQVLSNACMSMLSK